jgi:hypothetical protein
MNSAETVLVVNEKISAKVKSSKGIIILFLELIVVGFVFICFLIFFASLMTNK